VATTPAAEIAPIKAGTYHPGCDQARAAGAAPIRRGLPGYRESTGGDGVACEATQ
jgi:hypothetical protein